MNELKIYQFSGIATVSVTCEVEAETEDIAFEMIANGDCEWRCDDVDGDVKELELVNISD